MKNRVEQRNAAREIASLVADLGSQAWLAEFFDLSIDHIRFARVADAELLTRKNLQSRLIAAAAAAEALARDIFSPPIRDLLARADAGAVSDEQLGRALLGLERRLTEVAESAEIAKVDGSLKRGRGKARVASRVAPELVCSVVAMEVVQRLSGRPTPVGSQKAAAAAQKLWEVAGGDAHDLGEEPLARWKQRFSRVRDAGDGRHADSIEKLREEIRAIIVECENKSGVVARRTRHCC